MHISQIIWLVAAGAVVFPLALTVMRGQPRRHTTAVITAWLVAALTSGAMLTFIASKVGDLIPHTTAVVVSKLTTTGVLTGAFLIAGSTGESDWIILNLDIESDRSLKSSIPC